MEGNPRKNNRGRKKKKIELVFDPDARRDFLSGFHKRKLERKAKFQEELKKKLKDEKRRIKQQARESYKTMVKSHEVIPELEHLFKEEHDLGTHSVEIVELSTQALAEQNNWIGANHSTYAAKEKPKEDKKENIDEESDSELVPGMGLKVKVKKQPKEEPESEEEDEESNGPQFRTAQEIKKQIKKEATKTVKKSKAFQMKNKLEKLKLKKKSLSTTKRRMKVRDGGKKGKHRKHANAVRSSKMARSKKK